MTLEQKNAINAVCFHLVNNVVQGVITSPEYYEMLAKRLLDIGASPEGCVERDAEAMFAKIKQLREEGTT